MIAGSAEGLNEKPSVPKCREGVRKFLNSTNSLAVFYVEQVALNRHVTPQLRLTYLCYCQAETYQRIKQEPKAHLFTSNSIMHQSSGETRPDGQLTLTRI